jgi:NAD(P)-dependent dehydrogenase (short-subunit alcohol dehydrogenase family)
MDFKGQVAIVTGAGRGFGKAIALRFAHEGASVALTARSRDELVGVAGEIATAGGRALAIPTDVTSEKDIRAAIERCEGELGPIGIVISNAGVPWPFGPIWVNEPDQWWKAQEVHIRGPQLLLHVAMPGMVARKHGCIIFVSAIASHLTVSGLSAYIIGKTVQRRLAEIVAFEGKEHGIAAFAIDPGLVATRLMEDTLSSPDAQRWLPGMVERLKAFREEPDTDGDLARCAQRCVDLASGRYDALSGLYCELPDDLDALLVARATER